MGETKENRLHLGFSIVRIITAALAGIFFVAAFAQIIFFQDIKISFQTGVDAQQFATIKIKKGTKVDLPKPLKPGSYFLGWSLSPSDASVLPDSSSLMRDTTLYAVWDGAEKYAVLSVNGMAFREVNIFDTRIDGLTADELTFGKLEDGSDSWRVLDDYAIDNPNLTNFEGIVADPYNNFSRFLGWQYLNIYNTYNDLLFAVDADGKGGTWTWVKRDGDNNIIESIVIDDEHKFYPPNYRTTFKALLDYRSANLQFFDRNKNNQRDSITIKLGEESTQLKNFTIFKDNQDAHFSYWKLNEGSFKGLYAKTDEYPELANLLANLKTRYAAGETFDSLNPLLYYLGKDLMSPDGKLGLQVSLKFDAVYWDDADADVSKHQFTMQSFTDQASGTEYKDFKNTNFEHLSPENPVGYDEENDLLWLYDGSEVFSYAFYDHKGVYHEISTDKISGAQAISLDVVFQLLDEEIYLNSKWGINIMVNYPSATVGIDVVFNYGNDLYLLPNYRYYADDVTVQFPNRHIGNTFEILTGEKYMKVDYIFIGWQIVGDKSGRRYSAGENFTIPNFDANQQSTSIQFEAVWQLQRLLFNFDFDGGSWATEEGPDFTIMKGAYGERVRVVNEEPVKFGYDFVGWTIDDDQEKMYQPGDNILVGIKFKTLHAHWTPRRLRVSFKFRRNERGDWGILGEPVDKNIAGKQLYSGDEVVLPLVNSNEWYTFNGWQISQFVGKDIHSYVLTADILSQLESWVSWDNDVATLNVAIYADQTACTTAINYYHSIEQPTRILTQTGNDITNKLDLSRLVTAIPQGDYFYNYYPFSLISTEGSYASLDSNGRPFEYWAWTKDGHDYHRIDAYEKVPSYKNQSITVIGQLGSPKTVAVEFYDYQGNRIDYTKVSKNIDGKFDLPHAQGTENLDAEKCINVARSVNGWGTFVGWSPEPDQKAGNPAVIFDVFDYFNENGNIPELRLANCNDTAGAPYLIDIDNNDYVHLDQRPDSQKSVPEANYVLKLYAIYSTDYAKVTYVTLRDNNIDSDNTELKLPVYSNQVYTQTKIGGRTVEYNSTNLTDFVNYGNVVLDDRNLTMWGGINFVGWVASLPDGVSDKVRETFENRIWFPGDYLPSIDFELVFNPVRVYQDSKVKEFAICKCGEVVEVGTETYPEYCSRCGEKLFTRTYRILSLSDANAKINYTGSVDIVALPRGSYRVKQGGINITSDREVHVVVPAEGEIELQPRAIQCNTIKEFYVGDNLSITGSPVVGPQFEAYRIKKGYRKIDETNSKPTSVIDPSVKYRFADSMKHGLLVSNDGTTLLGVPSHAKLTTAELNQVINQSITHIAGYALSDINHLRTIDLTKAANLTLDANAIYGVSAQNIILPAAADADSTIVVSPQVLAGPSTSLEKVTFGNDQTMSTWYAFVDNNGLIYYIDNHSLPTAKTHLMYVLSTASRTNLNYIGESLVIPASVSMIEPESLCGLNWNRVHSVMAENNSVDMRGLLNTVPNQIPLFTNIDNIGFAAENNWYQNTRVQSYYKTFRFTYKGETIVKTYAYGQTFRVFSAQKYKDENNHEVVMFDQEWSYFVGWMCNNRQLRVGTVYRVGIDSEIVSMDNQNETIFNASPSSCWMSYPVQLITYNQYQPQGGFTFKDFDGDIYAIEDLINKYLHDIYLPALDQKVIVGSDEYQFVGWSKIPRLTGTINDMLWNNVATENRILPNKTSHTTLDSGNNTNGVYKYYALYEKVTPGLKYNLEKDGTYIINGLEDYNITSLNIPFAKYNAEIKNGVKDANYGYMTPVTKIGDRAFGNISNALTNLEIGGAVKIIGNSAFNGARIKNIIFNHKDERIEFNKNQGVPEYLTIGEYAFAGNATLEVLHLPLAVETISKSAFESCRALHTVDFVGQYNLAQLRYLGDTVFKGDDAMTTNLIVNLLEEDVNKKRLREVGNGIFQNTEIKSTIVGRDRIVWGDTLLRIYFKDLSSSQYVIINEKVIAGYAFANLGAYDLNGNLIQVKVEFNNANVVMRASTFGYLHDSINELIMNRKNPAIDRENIDLKAFDEIPNTHSTLTVRVPGVDYWNDKFKNEVGNKVNFTSA